MLLQMLGPTVDDGRYLDVGGDNGVISYLLRQQPGNWESADLDQQTVTAIQELVGNNVHQISAKKLPFATHQFDAVLIVDFLEHIEDDQSFIAELFRVIRPGGKLIVNVPNIRNSWLRRLRLALGQTDEKHGHVRHGYTVNSLERLLGDYFSVECSQTYSRFFSELVDTFIVQAVYLAQRNKKDWSSKGAIVTGYELKKYRTMFWLYSLIYPLVWLIAQLDRLLFFRPGYMLILRAERNL